MSDNFITELVKRLSNDLETKPSVDFIGDVFEERSEEMHSMISSNNEYKKRTRKICKIEDEIKEKFNNAWEILEVIEKHYKEVYARNYLCEKIMYKQGLLDGILFIIEGTKRINITKFFQNNQKDNIIKN